MIVKLHETNDRKILAICDDDLIGKTFEEGKLFLEVKKDFYNGEKMDEDKVLKLIEEAEIINVVGEKSVNFLIKHDIIDEDCIIKIKGVPHGQVFKNL